MDRRILQLASQLVNACGSHEAAVVAITSVPEPAEESHEVEILGSQPTPRVKNGVTRFEFQCRTGGVEHVLSVGPSLADDIMAHISIGNRKIVLSQSGKRRSVAAQV